MAANTSPIFSRTPDVQFSGHMTAVNTTTDLTSGTIYLLFTADSTEGGYVDRIKFRPSLAGTTTKTVARIWLNNGSTTGTAANNQEIDEITLSAVATDADDEVIGFERQMNMPLPASWRIYITLGTGSANGWYATTFGGKY